MTDDAATVREAHSKAMEALAADVHPLSALAIRDWEEVHEAALDRLAAQAARADRYEEALRWLEKEYPFAGLVERVREALNAETPDA